MLKKLNKIILVSIMVIGLIFSQSSGVKATQQDDINIIKDRLKSYFLTLDTIDDGAKVETCYVSKAEDYLNMIQEDGSFSDVNYKATNNAANGAAWSPYLALDRMQAIAIAYHKEGNTLYQSATAVSKLEKAILYWQSQNPTSTNWWENQVGVQLRFGRMGLFTMGVLSEEANNVLLNKLLEKVPVKYGTGQNNLWFDQNYIYYALLTNNAVQLEEMVNNYLDYCLSTQLTDTTAEAVQVDNSFFMHGRQFYSNGYGLSMFRDMSFWIYMLRDTQFAISQEVVDRMANYMLEGTRWTIRGDIMELYLGYRPYKEDVGYLNYAQEYIVPLQRMIEADAAHAADYQKVLDNVTGSSLTNGRNGNYYMWRSGYESHMRDGYGVNIKMDSKNLIGGEWRGPWGVAGKPNQQLIYWTSTASSSIVVDGDEYTSVYPVFDWTHVPGVTAPNYLSGVFNFENSELFNIGVSDGTYGATAYKFNKSNTKGQKGYFFFDDEFVALGTNISSTTTSPVHTTLNQSKANDLMVNGVAVPLGSVASEYTTRSIYNNKVGYVFLEDTKVKVSNATQKDVPSLWPDDKKQNAGAVFTAYIDHGVKPTAASYAYIVVPNKTSAQVSAYADSIPISVVVNNANVQAVRHDGLKQTQINFYTAGSLEYKPGYVVSVDKPCSLIIDESTSTRKITFAVNDNEAHKDVTAKLAYNDIETSTTFVSGALPYAGQPLTLVEGADGRYSESSFTTDHPLTNIFDKDINTYWESQTNSNEWISVYSGKDKYIDNIDILWGDEYASDYDVYTSVDGVQFNKVTSVTASDGQHDIIDIKQLCQYIKIEMKNGNGDQYQIKELKIAESQLLSLNKPTTTSSVSTQAPTFVGSLAVDNNPTTRWASKRNSDDEWIIVDLQKYCEINAMSVSWENGCSDDYTIEVSDDNINWSVVKQLKTDLSLTDVIIFDEPVYGQYVKIHSHKTRNVSGKNYGVSIFELKVLGNEYKMKLETLYNQLKDVDASLYTPQSYELFNNQLIIAKEALDNEATTPQQIDTICLDLQSAYDQLVLKADKTKLSALITKSEQINEADYLSTTYQVLQDALSMARIVFDDQNATDAQVVDAIAILTSAYDQLVLKADKTELSALITKSEQVSEADYLSATYQALQDPLNEARVVMNNEDATQAQVADAIAILTSAYDQLVLKADKSVLSSLITKSEQVNEADYLSATYQVLQDALIKARVVMDNEDVTQAQVADVTATLTSAYDQLVLKANKSNLAVLINKGEQINMAEYTGATYQVLQNALSIARDVMNNEDATEAQIGEAIAILADAYEQLVLKANKSNLSALIAKGEQINVANYTIATYQALQEALNMARDVLNDENATQTQIGEAMAILEAALNKLVEVQIPVIIIDNSNIQTNIPAINPTTPVATNQANPTTTDTSDHTNIMGVAMTLMLSLLGYAILSKKNKHHTKTNN